MSLILFYDTETTGLPEWKKPSGSEVQPHIVQLAAVLINADTREEVSSINLIVKPDGWEISQEMTDIHGITQAEAMDVGIDEDRVLSVFLELWALRQRVAHNRTFDQRIIRIALKRHCDERVQDLWAEKDTHKCTMLMAKPIMQMPPKGKYGYKSPKLEEAYEHFTGKKLENAHDAMADVQACIDVYWGIKDHEQKGGL